jgi:hypothetical protein
MTIYPKAVPRHAYFVVAGLFQTGPYSSRLFLRKVLDLCITDITIAEIAEATFYGRSLQLIRLSVTGSLLIMLMQAGITSSGSIKVTSKKI